MKKFLAYLLLLTLVFVGFACGEKEDEKTPTPDVPTVEEPTPDVPTEPDVPIEPVEPTPEDPEVPTDPEVPVEKPVLPADFAIELSGVEKVYVDDTKNTTLTHTPEDFTAEYTASYSSSDEEVLYVNPETGAVQGKKVGTATVTAVVVGLNDAGEEVSVKDELVVTVEERPALEAKPTSITISGSNEALAGYPIEFKATVYPANANQNVTWTSTNPDILSIDENGKATPRRAGTARIRAISAVDENVKSVFMKVKVKEPIIDIEIPDMKGYKIVIMNASSALGDLDPFLDSYTKPDKMYKQSVWLDIEKEFNCDISVVSYPDSAPWGSARINYIIENARNNKSTADLSVVSSLWLHQFANESTNAAADVTDLYVKYGRNQMPTVLKEASTYKGKIYAASTGISSTSTYVELGLFYNMAWVEKLGVKDPASMFNEGEWNYTGFKTWAQEVQGKLNAENGEYALGGHPFYYWNGMTNATGIKIYDSVQLIINYDSQRSKDASNMIYQLVQAGVVDPEVSWAESDGGFIGGTTVMSTGYLWFVKNQSRWSDTMFGDDTRYGYVPFPYPDDLNKEDVRISQSEIYLLMYNAGRNHAYPSGVTLAGIYNAMNELYLRTIKEQENDSEFSAESIVYEELSRKIDNPESIKAIRFFTSDKVFYDPVSSYFYPNNPFVEPSINVLINGKDYQTEFDKVREFFIMDFNKKKG